MRFPKAAVDTVLILVGLALLGFGQQQQLGADGLARWDALLLLWREGEISDTIYSLIGPLFATPLYFLGLNVLQYYNILLFTAAIAVTYLMLRHRVDRDLLRRFLLILVAASMIAPHVRNFYGEVFTTVAVGLGLLSVAFRHEKVGWTAVVLGAANTPASLVGLGLATAGETVLTRRLRYLLPFVAGALLVVAEIGLRRGFDVEYTNNVTIAKTIMPYSGLDGFSYPFFFGLLAILFSFGKGLVFYLPGLLLPVRKRLRDSPELLRAYLLWMLFLTGLVLAYASWWSWYGGDYWGPRFFVFGILPASLGLAVAIGHRQAGLLANLATLAVLTLSVWIGANSLVLGNYFPPECFVNYYEYAYVCHFTPEFSQLWYPFVRSPSADAGQILELVYYAAVFVWLAAALVSRIVAQAADKVTGADLSRWRI